MPSDVPLASRLTPDELKLLGKIGSHLSRMLSGRGESPLASDRRDELGMLANMVGRVTTDLAESREQDRRLRLELQRRVGELESAHATRERLLARIRELSSPVLNILPGVLLVPLIGALDAERAALVTTALLERVASVRATIVILDVTGVHELDRDVTGLLLRAAGAVSLLGARTILCGVSPAMAQMAVADGIDLSRLTPSGNLRGALMRALSAIGRRVVTARRDPRVPGAL
ncbi:MAG TPA: STAS domain-containing protein [Polyangiaceae bacterium]|nr:STAS domain-containing protein [Polyangiaceae bacterium]